MKDLRKSLVLAERENIRLRDLLAAFVRAHGEMAKAVEAVLDAPGSITSSREVKPVVSSGATMTAAAVETTTAAAKVPSSRAATVPPSWHAKRPATDCEWDGVPSSRFEVIRTRLSKLEAPC